jgi:hypothetical protein
VFQIKKFSRKGCPLYVIQVLSSTEIKELKAKYHLALWGFKVVFLEEVPGLPQKRDLDFSIDIVPRAVPAESTLQDENTRVGGAEGTIEGYVG